MAAGKSVDLFLKITTVLVGADVASKLAGGFKGLASQAGIANLNLGKMVGTAAALTLGFKGFQSVAGFFQQSIEYAGQYRDAQEKLNLAISRFPGIAEKGAEYISKQQEGLTNLADTMQSVGLVASTDLQNAFSKLMKAGFSPDAITKIAGGFEGTVVAMKGVAATGADVADVATQIGNAVRSGRMGPEFREALGLTKEQAKEFGKLNNQAQRGAWIMEKLGKNVDVTARALQTQAGQAQRTQLIWRGMQETIGKTFLPTQTAANNAMQALGNAMTPVAEKLNTVLEPQMKKFADWLSGPGSKAIEKFGDALVGALDWVIENWDSVSTGLKAIGAALGTLAVISIITNPLVLAGAALTALSAGVMLLVQNWDKVGPVVDKALQPFKDIWNIISGPLKEAGSKVVQFFKGEITWDQMWTGIGESVGKIDWGAIGNVLTTSFTNLWNTVAQTATELAGQIFNVLSAVDWGNVAQTIGQGLGTAVRVALGALAFVFLELPQMVAGWLSGLDWGTIVGTVLTNALTTGAWLLEMGKSFVKGFVEGVTGADWGSVVGAFTKGMQQVWDAILNAAKNLGPQILNMITGGLGNLGGMIMGKIQQGVQGAIGKGAAPAEVPAGQYGGLFSRPTLVGEMGKPEMVIPMAGGERSRGLLSSAAQALGMGGRMGGGVGPTTVSVSPSITINGVPAGQEGVIAREVERAMEAPIARMLEDLRRARDEERRLAYV